ncbi:gliding motility lipoprotein GldH [Mucilaginibacter arboris]|uniref:Gliding motility lipoprotein GldH n=1 Tax=Mucilaginibacter arboris TaxID=2682090 RepID=A0A7K1SSR0_9SPHI|nr:gliding motility lipoprotein GldH [Mucilaginibacter arboris]MVN20284.1 gliding motility lipoprotein GldH [Mucilaginibacter arboris]
MIRVKLFLATVFIGLFFMLQACNEPGTLIDQSTEISNHNWPYINKIKTDVKIEDISVPYNIYFNLRHSADYKYSNIFILVHQISPDHQTKIIRYEFKLANPDGEWLGNGSGNLYSYRLPLQTNFRFPIKGTYSFIIEQNMRDNPLKEVADVGLRVERAK